MDRSNMVYPLEKARPRDNRLWRIWQNTRTVGGNTIDERLDDACEGEIPDQHW